MLLLYKCDITHIQTLNITVLPTDVKETTTIDGIGRLSTWSKQHSKI